MLKIRIKHPEMVAKIFSHFDADSTTFRPKEFMGFMMNNKIEKKLSSRDIKPTAMRILVLQFLMEQDKTVSLHSIEDAFEMADKSTIYRTLKTFEKNKLVHTIDDAT
jgi:Fe2+ or Zn2+ uptake regulation protein